MARTKAGDYDEKRGIILKRAAALFAECGYVGASISMIAKDCGFSKSLVYHYYPDKESLLFDVLFAHLAQLVDVVTEAVATADINVRERLDVIAIALLEAYRDHDAEHQVQLTSLKLLPEERQTALKDLERDLVKIFSNAIAAVVPETSRVPGKLKPLTMSLFGMLNWHYLWFRRGKGLSRADYARLACKLIVDGSQD